MEIVTELEKGEIELDLFNPKDLEIVENLEDTMEIDINQINEDLEDTMEIDINQINEDLEKTQSIDIGEENEQR